MKTRNFSPCIPQLPRRIHGVAFSKFTRVAFSVKFSFQTSDLLVGAGGGLFGTSDCEITPLDLFTPLAGSPSHQRHVFRLCSAADCLASEDVELAIALPHAQSALCLLQIGL